MKFQREQLQQDFEASKMTQQELEEKAGVPQSTISTVIYGETKCPKPVTVGPIAEALGHSWTRYYTS